MRRTETIGGTSRTRASRRILRAGFALVSLAILGETFASARAGAGAIPPIDFPGARQLSSGELAAPETAPPVPLPEDAPLSFARADSVIAILDADPKNPRTRYDLFPIDLDGDGTTETIAQVARIAAIGVYSRAWWGVYGEGARSQVLFWSQADERKLLSRLRPPDVLANAADSLAFFGTLPEFQPAIEMTSVGDLDGDGRSEIGVLLAGRRQFRTSRGALIWVLLSPRGDRVEEIFRTRILQVDHARGHEGAPDFCAARGFRVLRRPASATGEPVELLLEPWLPQPPDSLCSTMIRLDERSFPSDPQEWMPGEPVPASQPLPPGSFTVDWDGSRYSRFEIANAP
ncbi:MAG: hypothetical protein ACE15D_17195 [Candidatus Eisenbacteria bacterium]|nr:hypothetical protein [Candidatus Eisenbacteria bacterium]